MFDKSMATSAEARRSDKEAQPKKVELRPYGFGRQRMLREYIDEKRITRKPGLKK